MCSPALEPHGRLYIQRREVEIFISASISSFINTAFTYILNLYHVSGTAISTRNDDNDDDHDGGGGDGDDNNNSHLWKARYYSKNPLI